MEHKPLQSEDLPEDLLYRSHSQVSPVQAGFSDRLIAGFRDRTAAVAAMSGLTGTVLVYLILINWQ